MFVVCARFAIKPGQMDAFEPLILLNAERSREDEPECHRFDVCVSEDRSEVFLYELYTDALAFEHHKQTAHYLSFSGNVADMIADKRVETFTLISKQTINLDEPA